MITVRYFIGAAFSFRGVALGFDSKFLTKWLQLKRLIQINNNFNL
jgi:hypothetical protein